MQSHSQPGRDTARRPRSAPAPRPSRSAGISPFERRVLGWRLRHGNNRHLFRLGRCLLLLLAGIVMVGSSAMIDPVLHRGVETGEDMPYTVQNTGRELAVNVDLTRFDPSQIDSVLSTLQTSGFVYIRQPISWANTEPTDGTYNWSMLDTIINGATAHGLTLVVTIEDTPGWARRASELNYADAPPSDATTLADFATQLATRYENNLQFYQFYDRPNLSERWGGATPSPTEYVELLAAGFGAVRTANSEAKVLLAEMDPRGSTGNLGDDFSYIRSIYDVGGAAFFDIASLQLDGGTRAPSDRNISIDRLNLSRAILLREFMTDQGDEQKAIWATQYGWAVSDSLSDVTVGDYLLEGIDRARNEWPWMGPMFAWSLVSDPQTAPYSLLNSDGTAKPQFSALASFGASAESKVAPTGFVPMLSNAVTYSGNWDDQHLNRQVFQTTSETNASVTLTFKGTGVIAILRESPDAGVIHATLDGKPLGGSFPVEDGASVIDLEWTQAEDIQATLAEGLDDGEHVLVLTLASEGRVTIGGMIVVRSLPVVWPIMLLTLAGIVLLIAGFRDLVYVIANRWGHFDIRGGLRRGPTWGQFSERWAHR